MGKKLKWNLILMSVLYLALGVFLLMVPGVALNVVCYALGGVVLVCAVVQLVRYFLVERGIFQSQLTLISGLICLGAVALFHRLALFHQQDLLLAALAQQLHSGKDAGRAGAHDDENVLVLIHSSFYPLLKINCLPAPLPRSRPHGPAPRRWLRRRRGPHRGR